MYTGLCADVENRKVLTGAERGLLGICTDMCADMWTGMHTDICVENMCRQNAVHVTDAKRGLYTRPI